MSIVWKCVISNYETFIFGTVSPLQVPSQVSFLPELVGQRKGGHFVIRKPR
jgi:hypothetical protein